VQSVALMFGFRGPGLSQRGRTMEPEWLWSGRRVDRDAYFLEAFFFEAFFFAFFFAAFLAMIDLLKSFQCFACLESATTPEHAL
jgi:hypothetical protein